MSKELEEIGARQDARRPGSLGDDYCLGALGEIDDHLLDPEVARMTGSGGSITSSTSRSIASRSRKTRSRRLRSWIDPTISTMSSGVSLFAMGICEIP